MDVFFRNTCVTGYTQRLRKELFLVIQKPGGPGVEHFDLIQHLLCVMIYHSPVALRGGDHATLFLLLRLQDKCTWTGLMTLEMHCLDPHIIHVGENNPLRGDPHGVGTASDSTCLAYFVCYSTLSRHSNGLC